jgi:hypothetical protein
VGGVRLAGRPTRKKRAGRILLLLKKKKQKDFYQVGPREMLIVSRGAKEQKFFASFFEKEEIPSLNPEK